MSGGFAPLRSFIQRVERIQSEIDDMNDDKKEIFAEAKGSGFDVKIMELLIAERRKEPHELAERNELLDLYRAAMDGTDTAIVRAPAPAREAVPITPHNQETGEVIEAPAALAGRGAETYPPAVGESPTQNPEPGAGDEGMENGSRANPARTMLEPNSGSPSCAILGGGAIPVNREEADNAAEGGSPSPTTEIADELEASVSKPAPVELSEAAKASRAKAIAAGYVLSDEPFEPVGVSIPNFRANTDQVGRA